MSDQNDVFLGYHLRGVEDAVNKMNANLSWIARKLDRIDRKIDAIVVDTITPAERAALVAAVNEETKEVNRVAAELKTVAADMDRTAKP